MARRSTYSSRHGGSAPPWCSRDVDLAIPLPIAQGIRRDVRRGDCAGYTIRQWGTIVIWRDGAPIGSFTLVQGRPRPELALLRRIAWDERSGYAEVDLWRAFEALAGESVAGLARRAGAARPGA